MTIKVINQEKHILQLYSWWEQVYKQWILFV